MEVGPTMSDAERAHCEPQHILHRSRPSPSDRLNAVGLKASVPRLKILAFFATLDHRHVTADEVHTTMFAQGIRLSAGSVYRVLGQLTDVGILTRHIFASGVAYYELTTHQHHDHMICLRCGEIEDFNDDVIDVRTRAIAEALGSTLARHQLTLYGYCSACRA